MTEKIPSRERKKHIKSNESGKRKKLNWSVVQQWREKRKKEKKKTHWVWVKVAIKNRCMNSNKVDNNSCEIVLVCGLKDFAVNSIVFLSLNYAVCAVLFQEFRLKWHKERLKQQKNIAFSDKFKLILKKLKPIFLSLIPSTAFNIPMIFLLSLRRLTV